MACLNWLAVVQESLNSARDRLPAPSGGAQDGAARAARRRSPVAARSTAQGGPTQGLGAMLVRIWQAQGGSGCAVRHRATGGGQAAALSAGRSIPPAHACRAGLPAAYETLAEGSRQARAPCGTHEQHHQAS